MLLLLIGLDFMQALVLSQVPLNFVLPFSILPMLLITRRKDLMGGFADKPLTRLVGWLIAAAIILLNSLLLALTIFGKV